VATGGQEPLELFDGLLSRTANVIGERLSLRDVTGFLSQPAVFVGGADRGHAGCFETRSGDRGVDVRHVLAD
jgi:hypothetical protein